MASEGAALRCCKILCCVFVVFVNVISIIFGVMFAVLGILLLVGSSLIQSMSSTGTSGSGGGNETVAMFGGHVNIGNYYSSLALLSGSVAGLLIGLGVIIVVVSCIGCFGACIGVPACLIIYVVCVSLLFLGQVIVIIIWFTNSDVFKQGSRNSLQTQVANFKGDRGEDVDSASLSMTQIMFGCCGVDNGTDFLVSSWNWDRSYTMTDRDNRSFTFNLTYPVSCCKFHQNNYTIIDPYCPYNRSSDPAVSNWKTGCHNRVWEAINKDMQLDRFFYSMCGTLGLQILLILGALLICTAKRKEAQARNSAHTEVEYKMVEQKL